MIRRVWAAHILALTILTSACRQNSAPDLVLWNGTIFTADARRPRVQALAIRGERILAVGSSAEMRALAGSKTRLIDLQQRVVIPGLNDAHYHFAPDPQGQTLPVSGSNWTETAIAVEAAVSKGLPGTWMFGSVDANVMLDPGANRAALDPIAPDRPVLLRSSSGHGCLLNSCAMRLLDIGEAEPDPAGGYFERLPGGRRINGKLWEYAEWKPNRVLASRIMDQTAIQALRSLAQEAATYGITSMQIFPSMPVDRFARLAAQADLPIRVRVMAFPPTGPGGRDQAEIRQISRLVFPNSRVRVSGIKWILDGTPAERGAALLHSYADRPGWFGKLNFPEPDVALMFWESRDLEQQLLLQCVGDRAAEVALQAMEDTGSTVDWRLKRVRIERGDGMIGKLIFRAQRLGVIVVQSPARFVPALNARWGDQMQPLRSLLHAGIPLALGSDGPLNPWLNIMLAATHPSHSAEAISRDEAVAKGDGYLHPSVSDAVLSDYRRHVTDPLDLLSSREREVLQLIAEGKTNKDIATLLNLSVYTVDAHRGRIMEKLNLHSTGELVRFAVRKGLID